MDTFESVLFSVMVERSGKLLSTAMECQDQEVKHKLRHSQANGSSDSHLPNRRNHGRYNLRYRNGVAKSENRANSRSTRLKGKISDTVSTEEKVCGSSRKKSRNRLNCIHENGIREEKLDRRVNGKMSDAVSVREKACESSRKKSKKGLNSVHENGDSKEKLEIDDGTMAYSTDKQTNMTVDPVIGIQESVENCGPQKDGKVSGLIDHSQAGGTNDRSQAGSTNDQSQDADYSYLPGLNDELALLCLAHTSRAEYGKLFSINSRYFALAKSGELYKIRRKEEIAEQWVYMLASGQYEWRAFDPLSGKWRRLPNLPSDTCFAASDKESLCAGTHLLVLGREIEGLVIWRYDLVTNDWYKGPSMLTPRCLYASASCGDFAFVAGGISAKGDLLKNAERYDPTNQRWEQLPDMNKKRKLCSGCYMDGKFYVIGGTGDNGDLTCGEVYDSDKKTWEIIEKMKPSGPRDAVTQAPPLIAVANNELYALEASTNQLQVYIKKTNRWKELGEVPVRADFNSGWGVAFKSLGNKLLLIGGETGQSAYGQGVSIYTSRPISTESAPQWDFLTRVGGSFVFNCAIMAT